MAAKRTRLLATVLLAGNLVFSLVPVTAFAVPSSEIQAELDAAEAELSSLYAQSEEVAENLNATRVQLEQIQGQIEENERLAAEKAAELEKTRNVLSEAIAEDYKEGNLTLTSVFLDAESIEDVISRIYYANKVSDHLQGTIAEVKQITAELESIHAQLEEDRASQENLMAEQERYQAELDANIQSTEGYVAGLSVELQEALAEEEAARQAALAAAPVTLNFDGMPAVPDGDVAGTVLNAAYSSLGLAYVFGACDPGVAFDCSGLVMYCYACAGYGVSHYSGDLAAYCNRPISEAVPGDIVWRPNHVGIYIGDGVTIEAMDPSHGVCYGSLSDFVAAGSPAW